jgi:hypothetical protein
MIASMHFILARSCRAVRRQPGAKLIAGPPRLRRQPQHVLYESSTRNDVSRRKVILGGTPGQRTVKVPAWHGIDPEG